MMGIVLVMRNNKLLKFQPIIGFFNVRIMLMRSLLPSREILI